MLLVLDAHKGHSIWRIEGIGSREAVFEIVWKNAVSVLNEGRIVFNWFIRRANVEVHWRVQASEWFQHDLGKISLMEDCIDRLD